jgi:hypothetical protein
MLRKLSPVLLSLLLLAGCSSTFMYNQLDWLVPWYADDYVDLTRVQEKSLKQQLVVLLQWHRSEELPAYVEILNDIERDLSGELSAATVRGWGEKMVVAWERLEERALPMVFAVGEQLSDEQMADFVENLNQRQQELEQEYLSRTDEEYVEDSYDNFEENLSDILGSLTDEQEQYLRESTQQIVRYDHEWLAERREWLQELETLLERKPGWQQAIMAANERREAQRRLDSGEDYRNQNLINAAIAGVLNLRTDKQSRRLQREIDTYRGDLLTLISQSK